jgi:hypothetical protein
MDASARYAYYNSVENPAWMAARQKERDESSRVNARRHYDTEDKFKLMISVALIVLMAIAVRNHNDDDMHYQELRRKESSRS